MLSHLTSLSRSRRATLGAFAAMAAVGGAVTTGAAAGAAGPTSMVMTHNVLPGIVSGGVAPTGTVAPDRVLDVAVGVARPDPAGEDRALRAMYDPASPGYGEFLTPDEFAARFGVAPAVAGRVTGWMRSGGLVVDTVSAPRDLVLAHGTAAQIDSLFRVTLRTYHAAGVDFFANDSAPTVPAGLGITTVMGLNSYQHASTMQRTACTTSSAGFCTGNLNAEDIWSIYNEPDADKGQGQSIAILGEGDLGSPKKHGSVLADLRQFEREHHFPAVPYTVHCVVQNNCGSDTSAAGEWDLDQAASTGQAPLINHLDYYFAQDLSDLGQAAMISTWVDDPKGPMQANASFSECEQGPWNSVIYNSALDPINVDKGSTVAGQYVGTQLGNNLEAAAEPKLKQAAMMGRTLFAAAGDTGTGCTALIAGPLGGANGVAEQPFPMNPYPAGARYAVAVGGTVLYSDGNTPPQRGKEYTWTYTGGGSSPFLTAPDYQQNVTNLVGKCVSDPDGNTSVQGQLCRGVPDVAAQSGDIATNGYNIVSGGQDTSSGGTSLSSPLWVGVWTRVQSAFPKRKHGLGFANYTLYGLGKNSETYSRDFYDITTGSNGTGGCPNAATGYPGAPCVAQTGWDYVSGWGAPNTANIIQDALSAAGSVPHSATGTHSASPAATGSTAQRGVSSRGATSHAPAAATPVTAIRSTARLHAVPMAAALPAASGLALLGGLALVGHRRRIRRRSHRPAVTPDAV